MSIQRVKYGYLTVALHGGHPLMLRIIRGVTLW